MEIASAEQALEVIDAATDRGADRIVESLATGSESVPLWDVIEGDVQPMIARLLRSVEHNFWQRELDRRENDTRFDHSSPAVESVREAWDLAVRRSMIINRKELRQLVHRALTLQTQALLDPIECMNANLFARQESVPAKTMIVVATHLGIDERYVRALTLMAQGDEDSKFDTSGFRRIARDVDAKEFQGSKDIEALSALRGVLLVLGLRTEDDEGEAPSELARAVMFQKASPEGIEKVNAATRDKVRVDMMELEDLFAAAETLREADGEESHEEVGRFLDDLGVDGDVIAAEEASGEAGGVQFILTEEEKRSYVSRAVGRNAHLVDSIMLAIQGALTWDEVDRAIVEHLPDELRDDDLSAGSFRSRIR